MSPYVAVSEGPEKAEKVSTHGEICQHDWVYFTDLRLIKFKHRLYSVTQITVVYRLYCSLCQTPTRCLYRPEKLSQFGRGVSQADFF